jgi:hypothetical protein
MAPFTTTALSTQNQREARSARREAQYRYKYKMCESNMKYNKKRICCFPHGGLFRARYTGVF